MRVIITAAGEQKRWNKYLGVDKWLIPIDGEPLIYRTVRMLKERGINDIVVTSKYQFKGLKCEKQTNYEYKCDMYFGSRHLWKEQNLYLMGDVYYTEEAMDTIIICKSKFMFFGQSKPNSITGSIHRGCCGLKFPNSYILPYLVKFRNLYSENNQVNKHGVTWVLYRLIHKIPIAEHRITRNFTDINDLTTDFDYPYMYDGWIKFYNKIRG